MGKRMCMVAASQKIRMFERSQDISLRGSMTTSSNNNINFWCRAALLIVETLTIGVFPPPKPYITNAEGNTFLNRARLLMLRLGAKKFHGSLELHAVSG